MMKQYISKPLTACLIAALMLAGGDLGATDAEQASQYQDKLDRLYKSIEKVKKHLNSRRHKRGNVLTELHQLETRISENAISLKRTDRKIRRLNRDIERLRGELRTLDRQLQQQQQALAELARAAYMLGPQQQLKMLLNQQDPAMLSRVQKYFDYLNHTRQQQIQVFEQSIRQRQQLQASLAESLDRLQSARASQRAQSKTLQKQRRSRAALLARLEQEITRQEHTLSELQSSRQRIENLLKSLGELLADIPAGPDASGGFARLKGRLSPPLAGRLIAGFGEARGRGGLKWNGVLIATMYGEPVKAVSHGRVAFSDWLQGFGFITIIDHGDGYMTLYGHNESLFKQAGEWVEAGEVIATAGDSGGHKQPGLYFEIRERGKPVDPKAWFAGRL